MYQLVGGHYQRMTPNERGHYPIPPMEVELGVWEGAYQNQTQPWLRWWDLQGNLLLTGTERAMVAEQQAALAEQRAESAEQKAARLAERLREMGIDPDSA